MKSKLNVPIMLFATLWSGVLAAQAGSTRINEFPQAGQAGIGTINIIRTNPAPGSGSFGLQRIVEDCSTTAGSADGAQIGMCSITGGPRAEMEHFEFRIPDFDPESLSHEVWKVGHITRNGSGSGSAMVDTMGLLTEDFPRLDDADEGPVHVYVYVTDIETAAVRLYLDIHDMTLNQVVNMLNTVVMNAIMSAQNDMDLFRSLSRERAQYMTMQDPIGDSRAVTLFGNALQLEDIVDVVYEQTRCRLVLNELVYTLEACY